MLLFARQPGDGSRRARPCLDRRISGRTTLFKVIAAWEKDRNKHHAKAEVKSRTVEDKDAMLNPSAESQPAVEELLLAFFLLQSQRNRANVLPSEGLSPNRYEI